MVEHLLIRVCLHATARELRSGSENIHCQLIVIHMRNTTQQGETRRVTQKTRLKQGRIHGNPVADGWAGAVM